MRKPLLCRIAEVTSLARLHAWRYVLIDQHGKPVQPGFLASGYYETVLRCVRCGASSPVGG